MFKFVKKIFEASRKRAHAQKKIFVVDDSEVDRRVVSEILRREGYTVKAFESGEQLLEHLGNESPHLFLLDCNMPGIHGIELCRRVKSNDRMKDVPVMFITGLDTPKNIIDCFEVQAENYISKPINSSFLLEQVEIVLSNPEEK